jgi:WD40 repeat protein
VSFVTQFNVSTAISQFAINSSYVLLVTLENTLSIHSIDVTPKLLFKTNKFQHNCLKVYSVLSFFYIIDSSTAQLFVIDIEKPLAIQSVAQFKFECRSLVSNVMLDRSTLCVLSDDQSTLAIWDVNSSTITYRPVKLDKTTKIMAMHTLSSAVVFHDSNQQVHLQMIDDEKPMVNLGRCDILETKLNYLALFDQTVNTLIIYDVMEKRRGERRPNISCDSLCFSNDGKYLFGIALKKSILLMYEVNTGKCVEKLFVENLSPLIQATKDRLVLSCNDKLFMMSIAGRNASPFKRLENVIFELRLSTKLLFQGQ